MLVITALYYFFNYRDRKRREEEELNQKRSRQVQEDEKRGILYRLGLEVEKAFSVDLKVIQEDTTQDEVVRIVNLLAYQVAVACVNQERVTRGEKVEPYHDPKDIHCCNHISWGEATARLKIEWAKSRNLAIQICPRLTERLPHFSEFEPLKSYHEERFLQKKAKQANT